METNSIKQSPYQHKYIDKGFWTILIILMIVSIVSIFSASSQLINKAMATGAAAYQPILSHIGYLLLGAVVAYVIQFLPGWLIRFGGYLLLAVSIICLLLLYTPLAVSANGTERWLRLGPFQFQPSEFAKLSLIIVVADLLARIKSERDRVKYFWVSLIITGSVCLLVLPSNLSTVILIGLVILMLMFIARIPFKWLLGVMGVALFILIGTLFLVKLGYAEEGRILAEVIPGRATTWVSRIDNKITDIKDGKDGSTIKITDENYQAMMAETAVARGGKTLFGVGPGNSVLRDRLPLAYMDFIFAIIVEETGILGALFLVMLYMSILCRACIVTSRYADYSSLLMVMGLAIMLTLQAFISMEVAVGLGPVTGQPLPLISKGGTSIVTTCVYFGIMMSVCREQKMRKDCEQQAIEESQNMVPTLQVDDTVEMTQE